jgi:hypothetical protein
MLKMISLYKNLQEFRHIIPSYTFIASKCVPNKFVEKAVYFVTDTIFP